MDRSLRSLLGRSVVAFALAGSVTTALAQPRFAHPPHSHVEPVEDLVAPPAPIRIAPPVVVTRDNVRAQLAAAREKSLSAFHAYRSTNSYPSNTFAAGALNVWRDAEGRYCAAASILRITGGMDMSERIAELDNNIRLADVTASTDAALMDWILTSGLTQEELALIQEPFRDVRRRGEPAQIDLAKKQAETKRLAALYAKIEAKVKKQTRASLEVATDRLMANPDLAKRFLAGPIRRV